LGLAGQEPVFGGGAALYLISISSGGASFLIPLFSHIGIFIDLDRFILIIYHTYTSAKRVEARQATHVATTITFLFLFLFDLWVGGAGRLSANFLYISTEVFVILGLYDYSKALQVLR